MNKIRPNDRLISSLVFGPEGSDVFPAEIGALDLDDLGVPDDPQAGVDLAERLGRGGLAGAR